MVFDGMKKNDESRLDEIPSRNSHFYFSLSIPYNPTFSFAFIHLASHESEDLPFSWKEHRNFLCIRAAFANG